MPDLEPNSIQLFPQVDNPPTGTYDRDAEPLYGRNLRVALAMRGGSSLAVWIGGAVGELDLLRRIRWTSDGRCHFLWPLISDDHPKRDAAMALQNVIVDRARVYALALSSRGYDQVEFDALAGASAGGLNSVLYSVAQRAGTVLDPILGVWIQNGAFWGLLRGPGFRGVDAPLSGDEFFAHGVKTALETLQGDVDHQVESHRARHIVVDISATVIDTQDAADRVSRSGRGEFHFVGANRGTDTTAPNPGADDQELGRAVPMPGARDTATSLARLAYAARSTSSLPGGFEPALIYSTYKPDPRPEPDHIDFSYAFHVQRAALDAPFRIVDGGLTDNMPIDRAFNAVRGLASEVYSDRAIIYLDPAPEMTPLLRAPSKYDGPAVSRTLVGEVKRRTDPSSLLLRVVTRAFSLRANGESAAEKEADIDDFRMRLNMAAARRLSTSPLSVAASPRMDPVTDAWYPIEDALSDYAKHRAIADANLVSTVLQDPAVWQLESDLDTRKSYTAVDALQLAKLDDAVAAAYAKAPGALTNAIFAGPLAVIDCCLSLLTWVRALEDANFQTNGTARMSALDRPAGRTESLRATIYRSLDAASRAKDVMLRDVCDHALGTAGAPPVLPANKTAVEVAADELLAPPTPEVTALLTELDEVREALAAITPTLPIPLYDRIRVWAGYPSTDAASAIRVAAFAAAAGIPDAISGVRFWEISAATEPSHPEEFQRLQAGNFRLELNKVLALPRSKDIDAAEVRRLYPSKSLLVNAKLNGAPLGNFAGFLSGDWRRNDWLWGRLDAAAAMLEFITSIDPPSEALAKASIAPDFETQRDRVQVSILREAWAAERDATTPIEQKNIGSDRAPFWPRPKSDDPRDSELRAHVALGSDTIANLPPGYRVGLASRTAHLALRAFGRWRSGVWTVIVAVLLRPLFTVAPVIVDPPRALLVAALFAGLWTVGSETSSAITSVAQPNPTSHWIWWALPVIAVAALVVAVSGIIGAHRRWAATLSVLQKEDADDARQAELTLRKLRGPIAARAIVLAVLAAAVLVLTLCGNALWSLTWPSTFCGLVVGIGLAISASRRYGSVPARTGYPIWTALLDLIAAAVFVLAIAWPHLALQWLATLGDVLRGLFNNDGLFGGSGSTSISLEVAVVAVLLSLVCNWGWQAGFHPQALSRGWRIPVSIVWWLFSAVIAGAVGAFVCFAVLWLVQSPNSRIIEAVSALIGLFFAVTAQAYLTQLQLFIPSDATARRK